MTGKFTLYRGEYDGSKTKSYSGLPFDTKSDFGDTVDSLCIAMKALANEGKESGVEYLGGTDCRVMLRANGTTYTEPSTLQGGHFQLNQHWKGHEWFK